MKKLISTFLLLSLSSTILANSLNELTEQDIASNKITISTRSSAPTVPTLADGGGMIGGIGIGSIGVIAVIPEPKEPVINPTEHTKNKRPSTKNKHEEGKARRERDQGKEKKDKNGSYRPYKKKRGK